MEITLDLWAAPLPASDAFDAIELASDRLAEARLHEARSLWEAVPDPHVQTRIGGGRTVRFSQQYAGIPVMDRPLVVALEPDGSVSTVRGEAVSIECSSVTPAISAQEAFTYAFAHLKSGGPEGSPCCPKHGSLVPTSKRWRPRMLGAFPHPARPCFFNRGPFERHPTAELVFFERDGTFCLGWRLRFVIAGDEAVILVSADREPLLLSCVYMNRSATCFGPVFVFNPGEAVVERPLPMPLIDYPDLLSRHPYAAQLQPWLTGDETSGNNVTTLFGHEKRTCKLTQQNGRRIFTPTSATEQQLVNAFYYCNWLHDLLLLLGFSEAEGNFQLANISGAPGAGDRLELKLFPTKIQGGGKMLAHADGLPAELRLGVWPNPPQDKVPRSAALDADIIIHEFFHGVTQRLVGGRLNWTSLYEPQSAAMGEGWSDYFAITLQNYYRSRSRYTFASWVSGQSAGIRSSPYDHTFRGHYGTLGKPPHVGDHGAGEVWAAALIRLHEHLGAVLGSASAHELGWLLVVDSLKRVPPNPNFLDGRDALFESLAAHHNAGAFDPQLKRDLERATWQAFAELGMGRNASSSGTSLKSGIVADFTT